MAEVISSSKNDVSVKLSLDEVAALIRVMRAASYVKEPNLFLVHKTLEDALVDSVKERTAWANDATTKAMTDVLLDGKDPEYPPL